ncbi:hypothetical protein EDD85DRAFT_957056 [Armillaria nabsnona]|nr:hypothetical protein EDD85DRAFT_957056 [Armillaria nabsnona]
MAELWPTTQQQSLYMHQASVSIVQTLLLYLPAFLSYEKNQSQLTHIPWCPLPPNVCTKFYPLHVSTIEEASVPGNLQVHDDIYITQLKEKPDHHTLTITLAQICHGLLLDAWHVKCRKPSLAVFAQSNPTPADLLKIVREILLDYTCPPDVLLKESGPPGNNNNEGSIPSDLDDSDDDTAPQQTTTNIPQDNSDPVHQNVQCLLHDLLYFEELTQAISSGDFDCLKDILPDLTALFHGSSSNNYSTEILHLSYNLKKVWTPEFVYVLQLIDKW